MLYSLITQSLPAFNHLGFFGFISSPDNALPFITGTLATATLALLIAFPFSFALALFICGYYRDTKIAAWVNNIVNLCAVTPSIILGIAGYYLLHPLLITFNTGTQGFGILTTSLILAIMIIPYSASLSCYLIKAPKNIKEGAYSLGATTSEVIWKISFPIVKKGIMAAHLLAFGKALGETMIVLILMGNTGNTMASSIVNQFEVMNELKISAIFATALLLFLITAGVNLIARHIIRRTAF